MAEAFADGSGDDPLRDDDIVFGLGAKGQFSDLFESKPAKSDAFFGRKIFGGFERSVDNLPVFMNFTAIIRIGGINDLEIEF